MMVAASSVEDVVPKGIRYLKFRIVLPVAHELEHLTKVSGVTEAICKEVMEPGLHVYRLCTHLLEVIKRHFHLTFTEAAND